MYQWYMQNQNIYHPYTQPVSHSHSHTQLPALAVKR